MEEKKSQEWYQTLQLDSNTLDRILPLFKICSQNLYERVGHNAIYLSANLDNKIFLEIEDIEEFNDLLSQFEFTKLLKEPKLELKKIISDAEVSVDEDNEARFGI